MKMFSKDHKQAIVFSCMLTNLQATGVMSKTKMTVDTHSPLTQELATVCDHYFDTKIDVVDFAKVDHKRIFRNKTKERRVRRSTTQLVSFKPIRRYDSKLTIEHECEPEPEESLRQSMLGLTSLATFQTTWSVAFKKSKTVKEMFYVNGTACRKVNMMHTTSRFRIADLPQLDARMIEIPLARCHHAMYVLLPNKVDGLVQMEQVLFNDKVLNQWKTFESSLCPQLVHLALPKFKDRTSVDIYDVLPHMTVNRLSSRELSDWSINSSASDLVLTHHIIACRIKVSEKGLKAAATKKAHQVVNRADSYLIPEFFIKYPFLFIVSHRENQSIISIGRVVSPPLAVRSLRH